MPDCAPFEQELASLLAARDDALSRCGGLPTPAERQRCKAEILDEIRRAQTAIQRCRLGVNLTGVWRADDDAYYYVRHLHDDTVWWVGLHEPWHFHPGLAFTNVFRGTLDRDLMTVTGAWTDVPRGVQELHQGVLTLDVVAIPERMTWELHRRETSEFGATVWSQDPPIPADIPRDLHFWFRRVKRGGGSRNFELNGAQVALDHAYSADLRPYKDFGVAFGAIRDPPTTLQANLVDYCSFLTADSDGDVTFDLPLAAGTPDVSGLRQDDLVPNFWSDGWIGPVEHVRQLFLDYAEQLHAEIVMYARVTGLSDCTLDDAPVFPGWMEVGANSALVNGRPIEGRFGHSGSTVTVTSILPDGSQSEHELSAGRAVRVTGVITVDSGHAFRGDIPEIHPVYAIELLQDYSTELPPDLTGVWHCNDAGTYYVVQDGEVVWWLGLSCDQGRTFANVFRGRAEGDAVVGDWVDVPIGPGGTASGGTIQLTSPDSSDIRHTPVLKASEKTGGFRGSWWLKLYDTAGAAFPTERQPAEMPTGSSSP